MFPLSLKVKSLFYGLNEHVCCLLASLLPSGCSPGFIGRMAPGWRVGRWSVWAKTDCHRMGCAKLGLGGSSAKFAGHFSWAKRWSLSIRRPTTKKHELSKVYVCGFHYKPSSCCGHGHRLGRYMSYIKNVGAKGCDDADGYARSLRAPNGQPIPDMFGQQSPVQFACDTSFLHGLALNTAGQPPQLVWPLSLVFPMSGFWTANPWCTWMHWKFHPDRAPSRQLIAQLAPACCKNPWIQWAFVTGKITSIYL